MGFWQILKSLITFDRKELLSSSLLLCATFLVLIPRIPPHDHVTSHFYGCHMAILAIWLPYKIECNYSSYHLTCKHDFTCKVFPCTVLYCTVMYCTVLYCTVLYCTVLYCTVQYSTVQYSFCFYYFLLNVLTDI